MNNQYPDWIEGVCVTNTVGSGWCVRISGSDVFESATQYGKGRKSLQVASGLSDKEAANAAAIEWLKSQLALLQSPAPKGVEPTVVGYRYAGCLYSNQPHSEAEELMTIAQHRAIVAGLAHSCDPVQEAILQHQNERMTGLLKDMRRCAESKSIKAFMFDIDAALSDPTGWHSGAGLAGSGWIACSDRLPPYEQNVLVEFTTVNGTPQHTTATLSSVPRHAFENPPKDDRWFVTVSSGHELSKVTHWQPLPPSPKDGGL